MRPRRIGLKPVFFPLVENGTKRSTIRAGAKQGLVGPAMLVGGEHAIPVDITEVDVKRFAELTEGDAHRDGFASLSELRDVLTGFYPNLSADDQVSILHFKAES